MEASTQEPQSIGSQGLAILAGFALLKIALHLPVLTRYGYHPDELYFIACGDHPAFGYVDHAPFVPMVARAATGLFGESLFGLRILGVLAGAATVFFSGLLTRRLGGGAFASAITCLAVLIAPAYLRSQNMLCLPAFEPLFWVLGYYCVVRIAQGASPRYWLAFGLVAGCGLNNKHSMLLLGFGLLIGLLLTRLRRQLKTPWPWIAGGIAVLFLLPNLMWQASNDWATVGFLRQLNAGTMSGISAVQFLLGQVLYLHPLCTPLWLAGLGYLMFSNRMRPYRVLAWIWIAVLVLLLVTKSKIYYFAPAFPVLLAAGAVALERWTASRARLRPAAAGLLVLGGVGLAPVSLPVMGIDSVERYISTITFGAFENIYELTGDLRSMFGWQERLEVVADAYGSLTPEEQAHAILWADGYGNAGAIDFLGGSHGLPKAVSLDNTYWIWGLPDRPIDTVIGVGFHPDELRELFETCAGELVVDIQQANPWQRPFRVTIWRGPRIDPREIWSMNRPW